MLALLTPKSSSVAKRRFGPNNDGGYVLLNKSFGEVAVFGYGVGHDATFEDQVAEALDCRAFVFDHTLGDAVPHIGPRTTFVAEGVTAPASSDVLKTFSEHLERLVGPVGDVLLKIDIEGAEWDVIEHESFDRVTQLIFEFHDLDIDVERKTRLLQKISETFDLVHVHGVNFHNQPIFAYNRATDIPRFIECTFVRKNLVETCPCTETYPTPFDMISRTDAVGDVNQMFWNVSPTPINFIIPDSYMKFIKELLCPCDTVNGATDGFSFTVKETDAFPYNVIYSLEDVVKHEKNIGFLVMKNKVGNLEMRLTHPRFQQHGACIHKNLLMYKTS